jgi:uncharacterized membrane protein YvbJ
MVKFCESCHECSNEDKAVFCKTCGSRFIVTDLDALKAIRDSLEESGNRSEKIAKAQILFSFATLMLAIIAFIVAIASLIMTFYSLPKDEKIFGGILLISALFAVWFLFKQSNSFLEEFVKKMK